MIGKQVTLVTGVGQNVDMYSGDTVDITVTLTNPDGTPYDLTDALLWWGMGSVLKVSSDPAQIEIGETTVIHLLPADTATLEGGLPHQLRVTTNPLERVETLISGVVRISASVFQPAVEVNPLPRLVTVTPTWRVA